VSDASNIVSAHVIAMFLPSFFTGYVIAAIGVEKVVGLGLAILACAGAVAMSGVELPNFYLALVLLGIGWNFGFIGATTMLAGSHSPEERGRVQGMNDLLVFAGVTLASLSSGGLMNCAGGSVQAGWNMVNMAMLPFLVLAGGALIWLVMQPKELRAR
jgi:MFS family permease